MNRFIQEKLIQFDKKEKVRDIIIFVYFIYFVNPIKIFYE